MTGNFVYCYTCFLAAVFGLVMGSFLCCMASRMVEGELFPKGRSRCVHCGHVLGILDLIPLFSWLFLKGKCRYCGEKISAGYPLSELAGALVYLSVFLKYGYSLKSIEFLLLFSLVLIAVFSDFERQIIPDSVVLAGIILWFISALFSEQILSALLHGILNGLSVSLPLLLVVLLFENFFRKPAMGGGDIKLIFMLSLFFSWKINLMALLLSCLIGVIFGLFYGAKGKEFPFAPSIAAGWWCCMLIGPKLIDYYLSLF